MSAIKRGAITHVQFNLLAAVIRQVKADGPNYTELFNALDAVLDQMFDNAVEVSATTQKLIDLLIQRDQMGRAKYGTTLDRTDLTLDQWLQHQVEELLDGAGYALAAMRTNQEQGK